MLHSRSSEVLNVTELITVNSYISLSSPPQQICPILNRFVLVFIETLIKIFISKVVNSLLLSTVCGLNCPWEQIHFSEFEVVDAFIKGSTERPTNHGVLFDAWIPRFCFLFFRAEGKSSREHLFPNEQMALGHFCSFSDMDETQNQKTQDTVWSEPRFLTHSCSYCVV